MTRVSDPGGDLLPNPPVLWLSELSAAERLVLRAARQLDAGDPCPGLVAAEFHRAWNGIAAAWDAFLAVYGLVDVLTVRGRRPFRLRAAACPRITADERCLLALIAACQAGHESHAEALLVWLVPEAARARAGAEALKLAQALRRAGRRLHARRRTRPPAGGPAPQRKLALAR